MASILVNYPTRSRPHMFLKTMNDYVSKLSGKHQVHFLIKVDQDDPTMNNIRMHHALANLPKSFTHTWSVLKDCKGKIDAINREVGNFTFDFLVSIADDMECVESGWDDVLAQDMRTYYPVYNGALNYNTDPRLDAEHGKNGFHKLITLPVIGYSLYKRFGYIYHPDYISESCDNEQTVVFEKLGVLTHIDRTPIKHNFVPMHDQLMTKNMTLGWNFDRAKYKEREAKGFDLVGVA